MLVLHDTNDETGSVEAVGKEEKGSEVSEGVSADQYVGCIAGQDDGLREPLVLLESAKDLLPAELSVSDDPRRSHSTYSKPVLSLRDRGTRTLLLEEEPGETEQDPVEVGQEEGVLVDESIASERDQDRKIEGQSDDITP